MSFDCDTSIRYCNCNIKPNVCHYIYVYNTTPIQKGVYHFDLVQILVFNAYF